MNETAEKHPSMPMREKYWEECDADQKLDRLRDAIARVCRETSAQSAAIRRLASHSHNDSGALLIPIHHADPTVNYAGDALGNAAGGLYAHDNGIPHNLRTKRERGSSY